MKKPCIHDSAGKFCRDVRTNRRRLPCLLCTCSLPGEHHVQCSEHHLAQEASEDVLRRLLLRKEPAGSEHRFLLAGEQGKRVIVQDLQLADESLQGGKVADAMRMAYAPGRRDLAAESVPR